MVDGQVERCRASDAEPEDVGLRDLEVLEQSDDVGGEVLAPERPVDVVGPPVALEVGGDHPAGRGEPGEQLAELQIDVEQAAVQQEQRCAPRPVDLVVHLQAVHRSVSGLWGSLRRGHDGSLSGRPQDRSTPRPR
jgi:hypothetical protein